MTGKRNKTNETIVDLLKELLAIPSPPGRETAMAAFLTQKIEALGFTAETDAAGNLLVRLGKTAKSAPTILAAHMDEIALMAQRIEPDGRLRIVPSGGMLPYKCGERLVEIIGDTTTLPGVLSCGTGHTFATGQTLTWNDYWVFTGLSEAELRKRGICEGAAIVPARTTRGPILLGDEHDPFIAAWSFDDRGGMATLLRLLAEIQKQKIAPDFPLIVAFTVHEEGGCHGAKVLAHREQPEAFIAIDGCPVSKETPLQLDHRPGIWMKDAKTCYSQPLINALLSAAQAAGVALQRAVYTAPYSDASAVYDTGGAPATAIIGHVRENSHGFEIARLAVFDSLLAVLLQFVRTWTGKIPRPAQDL